MEDGDLRSCMNLIWFQWKNRFFAFYLCVLCSLSYATESGVPLGSAIEFIFPLDLSPMPSSLVLGPCWVSSEIGFHLCVWFMLRVCSVREPGQFSWSEILLSFSFPVRSQATGLQLPTEFFSARVLAWFLPPIRQRLLLNISWSGFSLPWAKASTFWFPTLAFSCD
jgi:hypothetical protein